MIGTQNPGFIVDRQTQDTSWPGIGKFNYSLMAQAWHLCCGNTLNRELVLNKPPQDQQGHTD